MPAYERMQQQEAAGEPVAPRGRGKAVLGMAAALFLVVGAYLCFTLVSESEAVEHAAGKRGYSSQYLPASGPSADELSFRDSVQAAVALAPEEAFRALADTDGAMSRAHFEHIFSALVHSSIADAASFEETVPLMGPFTPFFTTVTEAAAQISVSAPAVSDRIFNAMDAEEPRGTVTEAEFSAFLRQATDLPPFVTAFNVLDGDRDGKLSPADVNDVLLDALKALVSLGHQVVDVADAGVEAVTPVAAELVAAMFAPSLTFDRVWETLLSSPDFSTHVAPALTAPLSDPALADVRAQMAAKTDAKLADFTQAVADGGDERGLDVAAYAAFATRELAAGPLATNPEFVQMLGILNQLPGLGAVSNVEDVLATDEPADGTALRGTPSPLSAVLDVVQTEYLAQAERLAYAVVVVVDTNRDDRVSVAEFTRLTSLSKTWVSDDAALADPVMRVRAVLEALFDMLDANGDGSLSGAELHYALDAVAGLVRQACQSALDVVDKVLPVGVPLATTAALAAVDANSDGAASLDEVVAFATAAQQAALDAASAAAAQQGGGL